MWHLFPILFFVLRYKTRRSLPQSSVFRVPFVVVTAFLGFMGVAPVSSTWTFFLYDGVENPFSARRGFLPYLINYLEAT